MNNLLVAVRHLTTFKGKKDLSISDEEIQQSLLFFPLTGFLIGVVLVLINIVISRLLPGRVVDILLVLFMLLFTDAKHLKGMMSLILGIANFSRIKSTPFNTVFGIFLVVFFVLITKYLLLNSIVPGWKNEILLVMPVIGRWSLIFFPYLTLNKPEQNLKINPLYGKISIRDFWISTAFTSIMTMLLIGINGLVLLMMISFITVFFERLYQKKEKGVPEYLSLAIVEIIEIMVLIFFIVLESSSRNFVPNGIII